MKKNIYKWHRVTSLIIAIPVFLWAASGFMHPIMSTFRPNIATQVYESGVIDSTKIVIKLKDALRLNNIKHVDNFRFVHIEDNWFYQIRESAYSIPIYLSTSNGKKLKNGDRIYAIYLAKIFLEGQSTDSNSRNITHVSSAENTGDCCDAATQCVMLNSKGSKIKSVELISDFDEEYKYVNRLLPVYKVSFDRGDGIRIYVETFEDRFGYAVDNKRSAFDAVFSFFHTLNWLDGLGNFKYFTMIVLMFMTICTSVIGIYIFFNTTTKKVVGNKVLSARKNHRWTSIVFSLFTLMFSFSGAFHAWENTKPDHRYDYFVELKNPSDSINLDVSNLASIIHKPITNVGIVKIDSSYYWQVYVKSSGNKNHSSGTKDLMKSMQVSKKEILYVSVTNTSLLKNGDEMYAKYLASVFSGNSVESNTKMNLITKFEGEYGFVNKRLPIWKVSYDLHHNERYYVETSSGRLSVRVDDLDVIEGYSFSFLHKHHFMDFAGKTWRDFSTMFWATGQIAVICVGLILWWRKKKQR